MTKKTFIAPDELKLTVKGGQGTSGVAKLFSVQHSHAGLTCASAQVIRWGNASIHAPATSGSSGHPLFGLQGLAPLLAEPVLVPQQTY